MLKNVLRDATGMLLEVYEKRTDGEPAYLDADVALTEVSEYFNIARSRAATMLINASEDEPVLISDRAYWTELPLPK